MKNFKSKLAEKAGFTLVELIVVIAILGILAGVAVPSYTGYVKKANDAAVESQLSAIKTAGEAAAASQNTTLTSIVVNTNGTIDVDTALTDETAVDADFAMFYTTTADEIKDLLADTSYATGAHYKPADGWDVGTTL